MKNQKSVHTGKGKKESCGNSFSEAGYLKIHIRKVHDSLKNYKCESCDKSFSLAGDLKRHIHTIHEGHKDYQCESCGRSFSQPGNLNKHIHTVACYYNALVLHGDHFLHLWTASE